MALINNYYVCAEEEEVTRGVDVTQHPVETGIKITDNVKRQPITLSLNGKIVSVGNTSATTISKAIEDLHINGKLVKFQGINTLSDALITNFKTKSTAEISGGFIFEMEITEVRIAKSAYKASAKTSTTTKQVTTKKTTTKNETPKKYHTVKYGDCPWALAVKYYGDGTKWTKIIDANQWLKDRNKKLGVVYYMLYVGDKLLIP